MRHLIAVLLAAALATPTTTLAASCSAKSGSGTVALLELFTSEGCSSCPRADHWLAQLRQRGFGPERVVPLALHVDYWNGYGWTDRFAQAAFTERQHEYARRKKATTIYTPNFKLSGDDYRRWLVDRFETHLERINRQPARADIALQLERHADALRINGNATLRQPASNANVYLALFENNLSTDVQGGENSGYRLEHTAVVRRLVGPLAFDAKGQLRFSEALGLETHWKTADLGVAAFVQESNGVNVLQALMLNLCSEEDVEGTTSVARTRSRE